MDKKVTVEILITTSGIGKQGEIKEVSLAQARNQLFPRGLAREVKVGTAKSVVDPAQIIAKRHDIVARLTGKQLTATVAGGGAKISGHFDESDVCELIKKQYQIKLLPQMISFVGVKHPKKAGTYDVQVHISEDAYVSLPLTIHLS